MRVYLDACCLSRLTDDHSQTRIREEAEAVEQVLAGVRRETTELLSSEALEDEVRRNPSMERRGEAQTTLSFAVTKIAIDDAIAVRAQNLVAVGYGPSRCGGRSWATLTSERNRLACGLAVPPRLRSISGVALTRVERGAPIQWGWGIIKACPGLIAS